MATIYTSITPIEVSKTFILDELRISVDYSKGEGVYVYVVPVKREQYSERQAITGNRHETGLRFKALPMARRNQKKIDMVFDKINKESVISQIVELYETSNYGIIPVLVKEEIEKS